MQVLVNGVRLFFDVEGAAVIPDAPERGMAVIRDFIGRS